MHTGPITAVLASKDGKEVYTAGYGKEIYVWNRQTGQCELLGKHEHLINSLALSESGELLASASSDYTINVYDLKSRALIRTLFGHADDVEALAFAEHDTLLVSTSRDRRAMVFNLTTGAIQTVFQGHSKDVLSLWVNQGRAFTTGDDGRALIWDLATGAELGEIGPFDCELDAVSGNESIDAFAIGADDGRVMIYNASSLQLQSTLPAHDFGVKKVVFSPTGRLLLTAGYDHLIKIWSTATGELVKELSTYKYQWERALAWTTDERSILGASFGVRYCEWSLATGELISPKWELATPSINDLAISEKFEFATASDDGRFRIDGKDLGRVHGTLTNGVGISDDGQYVVWGDHASEAHIMDRTHEAQIRTIRLGSGPVNSVFFCSEDQKFYVGTYGGHVHVIDPVRAEEVVSWKAHGGAVKAVQADGQYVLTCSSDNSIHLFQKGDLKKATREFFGPTAIVNDIFLDSVNGRVISVSRDKVVRIYDLDSARIIAQHDVHRYSIKSVTVTEDGHIVSADYWGYVVIWNPRTGILTSAIRVAENGISALRRKGNSVYASSYDGGIYMISTDGTTKEELRLFQQGDPSSLPNTPNLQAI
ncbi:WD40 repeat domain-containing protein [Tumebacillus lipolyticus]|uniref:WD40 repeat domain-containing protein n=1 Tax=Tumebacillus lipolyticus TaxID=1280370 RepID=A0ABW5A330_9BACL